MAKLGYTWYPKDWGNSESVFELSLSERGLYRELIDLAMLNDNNTEVKKDVWIRKFYVSIDELNFILCKLISLNLIEINDNVLFIQSCETRLNLVRGGAKGGKNSKPTNKPKHKPTHKPFESLDEKNEKPTQKQIEKKEKGKESKVKRKVFIPPSLEEVKVYFLENKYNEQSAIKFFNYYDSANWKDSKDNQVKNWKQKAQGVWFKPENEIKTEQSRHDYLLNAGKM